MKLSTIFRSRWMALIWAAGVVWTALDVAGVGESTSANGQATDVTGSAVSDDQVKSILADL